MTAAQLAAASVHSAALVVGAPSELAECLDALSAAFLAEEEPGAIGHLNYLQGDTAEMLDMTRKIENYDATLAATQAPGKPIEAGEDARAQRRQRGERLI